MFQCYILVSFKTILLTYIKNNYVKKNIYMSKGNSTLQLYFLLLFDVLTKKKIEEK